MYVTDFLSAKNNMGGNRRRRRRRAGNAPRGGGVDDDVTKARDDVGTTILVRMDSSTADDDGWSVDYVMSVDGKTHVSNADADADDDADATMSSMTDIGLLIARGTLDRITRRNFKRSRKRGKDDVPGGGRSSVENTATNEAKPTPVQLRLWPALLDSLDESRSHRGRGGALNVVGIAPTGTGEF